jgi:hypothetical protein
VLLCDPGDFSPSCPTLYEKINSIDKNNASLNLLYLIASNLR